MEYIVGLLILIVIMSVIKSAIGGSPSSKSNSKIKPKYYYGRKDTLMTPAEVSFYHRLESVVANRYYIFPQVHLSALLINQTKGKYWKAAFQRINRTSVDYVLCDKQSMRPVYAIELDDSTHDTAKRRARDSGVDEMLSEIGLPVLHFRNVGSITDEQITEKFQDVAKASVIK